MNSLASSAILLQDIGNRSKLRTFGSINNSCMMTPPRSAAYQSKTKRILLLVHYRQHPFLIILISK
jgi:hypothetical protein